MQGRKSGTAGNVKATDYLAAEAKRIGLEPAGENGGWFQTVPIVKRTLDPSSGLTVDGTVLKAWDDLIPRDQGKGTRSVEGAQVGVRRHLGPGSDPAGASRPASWSWSRSPR